MTNAFDAHGFTETLILIGIVIIVSALLSGFITRSGLPQVAFFLVLGAALGPAGLGVLNVTLDSPILRIVATLSLALVLFTDAVTLNIAEVRRRGKLTLILLGPGTLLSAALVALAAWFFLGLSPAAAVLVGAALASTDPVLLRGLLKQRGVPNAARQGLRLESGLNDIVLLPIVLVAIQFLDHNAASTGAEWAKLFLNLFLLGPGAGVIVGLLAVATLDLVRRRIGIERNYESLYSLGVALAAFAAAESLHGSGFLAAFAAGLTISAFDVELCDCFLEYGEVTAEMLLLFTFVLFGSSIIWSGFSVFSLATMGLVLVVLIVRPAVLLPALKMTDLKPYSRWLIAWFGPRGLSSLLLVLLAVFDGVPGSDHLFAICSLVVLFSIVVHGGTPFILKQREEKNSTPPTPPVPDVALSSPPIAPASTTPVLPVPAPSPPSAAPVVHHTIVLPMADVADGPEATPANGNGAHDDDESPARIPETITIEGLRKLWDEHQPVVIIDARTVRTHELDTFQAKGAIRFIPEDVERQAASLQLPRKSWIIAYCA